MQMTKKRVSISALTEDILRAELYFSAPPGSVNVFLIRDGAGWLAIDAGVSDDGTLAAWDEIFSSETIHGLPVTRILITHAHYDHMALAGSLSRRTQAPLMMSGREYALASVLEKNPETYKDIKQAQLLATDMASETVFRILKHDDVREAVTSSLPREMIQLGDGDTLKIGSENWDVILTGGHSPAQICLHSPDRGLLFSADQILRKLPTFIPPEWSDRLLDPVEDFLDSLAKLRTLPPNTLVVPSHGKPFSDHRTRIDEITSLHQARCAAIHEFCEQPRAGKDVLALLFPAPASDAWLLFALEETVAYLEHLVNKGLLRDFWRSGIRFFVRA